jgi:zinc transporter
MKVNHYALVSDVLQEEPLTAESLAGGLGQPGESWYDVSEIEPDALERFLVPLALHPLVFERCLQPANDPSVLSIGQAVLLEFPAATDRKDLTPTYVTLLLQGPTLVTIRHSPMPAIESLVQEFRTGKMPPVYHLPRLVFLILDHLADANVDAELAVRDQISNLAEVLTEKPQSVTAGDLSRLRSQVDDLVSLIENQLYCVAGLNASDNDTLQEPHRKAYIQDMVAEAEIAQRSVYRLENRMNDLYTLYQMMGSDRVEKRLRVLTIVSATTLPLALITGILGMNVGGLPGTDNPSAFLIVMILLALLAVVELAYFVRKGWFD